MNLFADLVLSNGKIITMNEDESIAEAVARAGLIESHCYLSTAEGLQRPMGVIDGRYEAGIRSIADIQARIEEQAREIRKKQIFKKGI